MGAYDARGSEIEQGFEEVYKKAIAGKDPADVVLAQKVRMVAVLKAYIDKRNKDLEAALKILEETNDRLTEKDQNERWKNQIQKAGLEGFKMISDLDDDENNSLLNVYLLGLATQEGHFYNQLATMPLAAVQGFLLQESKTLEEEKKKLLGEWASLSGSAKATNERAKQAGEKVLEGFNKALIKVGEDQRLVAEVIRTAVKLLVKISNAPSAGHEPSPEDVLDDVGDRLDATVSTTADVARLYRDAYKSNETTLITIGNTRESVREFLEKTNLAVALKRTEEARKDALGKAGDTLTPGQQEDAKEFAELAGKAVQGAMDKYETSYNQFITEFKDIFVGPIATKVLDQLVAGEFWDLKEDQIKRLNFESELRKYYNEAEDMWDIPLSGVNEDLKDAFVDEFRKELREYDSEVEGAIRTYLGVMQEMFVTYPIYRLKEIANRSRGYDP